MIWVLSLFLAANTRWNIVLETRQLSPNWAKPAEWWSFAWVTSVGFEPSFWRKQFILHRSFLVRRIWSSDNFLFSWHIRQEQSLLAAIDSSFLALSHVGKSEMISVCWWKKTTALAWCFWRLKLSCREGKNGKLDSISDWSDSLTKPDMAMIQLLTIARRGMMKRRFLCNLATDRIETYPWVI